MSILIPSTEPGVLEDIGSLLTYNPVVEAYEDCERAMEHDGEVWREVWPEKLYLYKDGDECSDITGGWNVYPYRHNNHNEGKTPTFNKGANQMTISLNNTASNTSSECMRGCLFSGNKIDLPGFKTLKAHCIKAHAVGTRPGFEQYKDRDVIWLGISNEKKDGYSCAKTSIVAMDDDKEDFVVSVDLADVSIDCYIVVHILVMTINSNNVYVTIDRIWLE